MPSEPTFPAVSGNPDDGYPNRKDPEDVLQRILGKNIDEFALPEDAERSADRLLRTYGSKPALAEWAYLLRHEIYDVFHEARRGLGTQSSVSTDTEGRDSDATEQPMTVEEILQASPALQTRLALYRKLLRHEFEPDADGPMLSYMGKHWRRHDQERSSVNGAYEKASSLLAEKTALEEQLTAVLGRMFGHRKGDPDSVDVAERFALEQDIAAIDQHVTRIKQEKPEVAALLQHDEIQERLHEHHNGGFMQFVSRRKLVNRLLKGLVSTKPAVLMLGESGVGKTAVARELGKAIGVDVIYSLPPGDTSEPVQRLLATKGWEGNKDVYRFGSLLQAMTGYENSDDMRNGRKRHAGNIFFDDEFNKRSNNQQALILKFVAAAKPGQEVDVPGTPLRVLVQPQFAYLAAGNPPSNRYERNETPLEAYREVPNKLLLDYLEQTPEQPELYEAMVAALLDEKTGRLRVMGEQDIMPGFRDEPSKGTMVLDNDPEHSGVIWNFANAWKQTLLAFSHQSTELSKKDPTAALGTYHLDKIILDIGKVLQWLRDFKLDRAAQKRGIACFLTEKLIEEIEGQVHATPEEKILFAKFFKEHGIDLSRKPAEADFRPSEPHVLTPVQIGLLFPQVPRPSKKDIAPPKGQSAFLRDGSEVRYEAEPKSVDGNDRIVLAPGDTMIIDGGQEATYVGAVENKMQPFLIRVSGHYQLIHYSQIDDARTLLLRMRGPSASVDAPVVREAKDIIEKGGGKFYGPESLIAMGLKAPDKLPPMPPKEEVERYAALGFDMRLEVSAAPDGKTITPEWMNSILQKVFDALPDTSPKAGRILYQDPQKPNDNWYKKSPETFYSDTKLTTCWAFTSGTKTRGCTKGIIDASKGKNYLEQTDEIVTFVEQLYPKGQPLPQDIDVAGAVKQFKTKRKAIEPNLSGSKWKDAADELARLDINQIFRPEAQEVLFYFAQTFLNSPPNQRERLLEALYAWTKTQSSGGSLVGAGECDPRGARLYRYYPAYAYDYLGVLLVRKFRALKP